MQSRVTKTGPDFPVKNQNCVKMCLVFISKISANEKFKYILPAALEAANSLFTHSSKQREATLEVFAAELYLKHCPPESISTAWEEVGLWTALRFFPELCDIHLTFGCVFWI